MTITYEYEGALYVNLTNRCNCNCEFCLRHGKKEGSIYTEDSLWLEREPTRQEALDSFLSRDVCSYREIVFCGYGEPTYRIDDIVWLVDQLKERFGDKLPPVRINTNGHANLIQGRDVIPDLKGRIDTLSISLNANTAAEYVALCHPVQGEAAYQAMLDFAKEAKDYVPHVVFTVVDKGTAPEEIEESRRIADSLRGDRGEPPHRGQPGRQAAGPQLHRLLNPFQNCERPPVSGPQPGNGWPFWLHSRGFSAETSSIMGRRISSRMPGRSSMSSGGWGSTTRLRRKPQSSRVFR